MTDELEVEFWVRHVRIGVALTLLANCLGGLHVVLTWGWPNHGLLLGLVVVLTLSTAGLLRLPLRRLVRHPNALAFFYGWSGSVLVLVTVLALTS